MAADLFIGLGVAFEYEKVDSFIFALDNGRLDDGFIILAVGKF